MNNDNSAPGSRELTLEEVAAVFQRLRSLKKVLRPHLDSNMLAVAMIKAIIREGWDTGPRIVGMMKQLNFDGQHAGAILAKSRGDNPDLHYWRRDADGRYIVHE